ncbi:MBL fold metallo-hydrolase [Novosphingobium jiangmenense]|uniref:MBL fold metallo-hydrolase n=1 Tax=Novosphingobium jiangmenense TaxID=2791981 RepID=A0ABS0HAY4_9SPHN|nr:MBL fold metallo-hydrolase [Novosphingobium jiangmenense]MBF9149440.1 MBL fold metallo-hydrolase [Novosphingobium jiangmenense]
MHRAGLVLAAALLSGATRGDDPLTRPITGSDATLWLQPDAPLRVFPKLGYIGPKWVKQGVIDTGKGLVLIDAGLPEGLPVLRAHLAELGYRIDQVRWLLVTEPHYDHAGAIAAIVRESGARVYASASTAAALRHGISGDEDPQRASLIAFAPVRNVIIVKDGQRLRFGNVSITARAMPGHTPGSMGWSWQTCTPASGCAKVFFAASLNSLTAGTYRYRDHPELVAAFRRSIAMLRDEPCDVLLSNHADHSGADLRAAARRAGTTPDPMRTPEACKAMADKYATLLDAQLAREDAAPK